MLRGDAKGYRHDSVKDTIQLTNDKKVKCSSEFDKCIQQSLKSYKKS